LDLQLSTKMENFTRWIFLGLKICTDLWWLLSKVKITDIAFYLAFERLLEIKESDSQTMIGTEVAAVFLKRRVQPVMFRTH
jgi:hypothetical protein